jgi:hypothetical protein
MGPGLVGQFWALDADRILKLVLRVIVSQEIQMPPGDRRPWAISGHESKKSLELYEHVSLESVDKAYQDAVQSVAI